MIYQFVWRLFQQEVDVQQSHLVEFRINFLLTINNKTKKISQIGRAVLIDGILYWRPKKQAKKYSQGNEGNNIKE